jgi:enoyl-CoA hydratase
MGYEYSTITCSLENQIMLITLNRPQVMNALNEVVFAELEDVFTKMRDDKDIKVVVITGAGEKAFAAGTDINNMASFSLVEAREFAGKVVYGAQQAIANYPRPVIAAINGYCFGGGCEVAMCCDIRVASEKARFGQLEINVGIIPGGGGTQRLQRLIGIGRTKEMIYTGMIIDGKRAYEIGMVNHVVPHDQVLPKSMEIAQTIKEKSGFILELAKSAIDKGADLDLENGLKTEIELFAECFATPDQKEGMKAFIEKRKADFIL